MRNKHLLVLFVSNTTWKMCVGNFPINTPYECTACRNASHGEIVWSVILLFIRRKFEEELEEFRNEKKLEERRQRYYEHEVCQWFINRESYSHLRTRNSCGRVCQVFTPNPRIPFGKTIPVSWFFWEQVPLLCRWNEFSSSSTDMLVANGGWFLKQWAPNASPGILYYPRKCDWF